MISGPEGVCASYGPSPGPARYAATPPRRLLDWDVRIEREHRLRRGDFRPVLGPGLSHCIAERKEVEPGLGDPYTRVGPGGPGRSRLRFTLRQ
jgi:hypothetical protein